MQTLKYTLVDVFTTQFFGGNPLAVFHDGSGLDSKTMQQIANELNLSETAFICPPKKPQNQISLRIFTPQVELPIAGHPTIGTAFVMAYLKMLPSKDGLNEWTIEEGSGDIAVTVRKEGEKITKIEMIQPLPVFGETLARQALVADLLSLPKSELDTRFPIQTISSGLPFLFVPLRSLAAMREINFRTDVWERHFSGDPDRQHIFTFATETEYDGSTVHCRMFAPAMGIPEDPATGAASGPLGAFLVEHGVIESNEEGSYSIRSEQGIEMGRPSFIDITITKKKQKYQEVKIGGTAIVIGQGELYVP
ncbi:PhzF family phenazine biosynthesis protein [Planococcus antarcticus DSM 14505]|uniref:Phenazine biosynthesis protein PhzF n=1 Tax=Planococcus antarcticus DSM 14505 TaxID=1185653 RepID=A0A1C7DK63_9BACL|nr:PhzF family phenazine biosynthesis protein [Planococcus antarcticus]ANU11804.1 phenazine biosynthesis protein PhzF [Planococcus antarcticus DSM 14505]EIM06336.1 PhzF family phenazine biosynthesis protein [Planococcus antarcticus DSM 14505]